MRFLAKTLGMTLLVACTVSNAWAGSLDGEIQVGGIIKDEEAGDLGVMPETFNIYQAYTLSRIDLTGRAGQSNIFHLDVHELNQDSARGLFSWRMPDRARLSVKFDQHRRLFDAAGGPEGFNRNLRGSLVVTPSSHWRITAGAGRLRKSGDRVAYPAGTASFLGIGNDYRVATGRLEVESRYYGRTLAAGYEFSDFSDENLPGADREGRVFSLRGSSPCLLLPDHLNHFVRAAFGKRELTMAATEAKTASFQYLGVARPSRSWQFKYRFLADRVEDSATDLQTDRLRNDLDLAWFHRRGSLAGGYGRVTNDDDLTLTRYDAWRLAGVIRPVRGLQAKVSYSGSEKQDEEDLTLLKDMETSRFRARLQGNPTADLTLGAGYEERERRFPTIDVTATGERWSAFGRLARAGLGALNLDYRYSDDEYDDLSGGFRTDNKTLSGRIDLEALRNLRLSAGLTYLDLGRDLDIEKSIVSLEGRCELPSDYFVHVKYNVYNYDDYVLLDRYYTANVVWLNVGYKLSID